MTPDLDDRGWRDVVHDTRSLDCQGRAHDACFLPIDCRCECHR